MSTGTLFSRHTYNSTSMTKKRSPLLQPKVIDVEHGLKLTTTTVNSSCIYQYEKWNYKKAATESSDNPCTNVPIFCDLCPRTITGTKRAIWRYSAIMHAVIHHQQQHPTEPKLFIPPNLPGSMLIHSHISQEEEHALGVENELTLTHREDFNLPMSEGPIMQPEGPRTKRPRNQTISQVERQQKKKKN